MVVPPKIKAVQRLFIRCRKGTAAYFVVRKLQAAGYAGAKPFDRNPKTAFASAHTSVYHRKISISILNAKIIDYILCLLPFFSFRSALCGSPKAGTPRTARFFIKLIDLKDAVCYNQLSA
jgi:hypothetical protein